jgi:hypothetical protein
MSRVASALASAATKSIQVERPFRKFEAISDFMVS